MLCYKDRTWCNSICANIECRLNLTDNEVENAIKWWGSKYPPIAFANFKDSDECPGYIERIDIDENEHLEKMNND